MRDLRRYARQTNARLLAGLFALVFIVGLGLIYIFYGPGGAVTGLVCLLAALAPVLLIGLALWVMDRVVRRANED
jgi:TM2 domain-containing membrane protein YozV